MQNKIPDAKEIGRRLRELRGIRTRTGVAREIGIKASRLGNYELGIAVPPDDIKIMLADYYNVNLKALFFEPDYHETWQGEQGV